MFSIVPCQIRICTVFLSCKGVLCLHFKDSKSLTMVQKISDSNFYFHGNSPEDFLNEEWISSSGKAASPSWEGCLWV